MIWDSVWHNGVIVCCTEDQNGYGIIENGAIGCKDGKITFVGYKKNLPDEIKKIAKNIFDLKGAVITPSLIDCHTHLVYSGTRVKDFASRISGESYENIAQNGGGILSTVNKIEASSIDSLYAESQIRLNEALSYGTTTMEIKSGYGLLCDNEIKQLKVINKLQKESAIDVHPTFLAAHALPLEFKQRADEYIDYVCSITLKEVIEQKLATAVDAFCETIAFSSSQIEKIFSLAQKNGLKIKIHAEQLSNSNGSILAAKYNALSADHLEYADEKDISALAKAKVIPVLLPGAYFFLDQEKKPPIDLLKKHQIPFAIATDCNPGTSPTVSLTLMMNIASIKWKILPFEALRACTINAAKALGIQADKGSIEVNKCADFAIWNISHPDELCYHMGGIKPTLVIKNDKKVFGNVIS